MNKILYKEESAKIVGAIFEVHKRLGVGLLEKVYQEALAIELKHRNIPFEREKRFDVYYRDEKLDAITNYELGILCNFNELYMEPVRVLNSNLM